ncbi:extracellular solute-binding protein [Corynebacterium antarcticum]|uniref:extracellular solute-binding protein n=1 Tax=Corynebacterium antarcticum TaxID=2800405 RepID=UPI002002AEB8|nr:extracellular solute-binding protein [Corynebacterium antarcticum]MCK7643394.1 extracellular solute-binding protein [Corynebacterium antarcticum]MCX7541240.1 extracellular solute-binding protein [Corynebacterium antarcticum]
MAIAGFSAEISLLIPSHSDDTRELRENIISGFEADNPGVTVDLQVGSRENINDVMRNNIQANKTPDILNIDSFTDHASEYPLHPAEDVVSAATLENIQPSFRENASMDGTWWGLPLIASARALFCNRDRFERAGISVPPADWNALRERRGHHHAAVQVHPEPGAPRLGLGPVGDQPGHHGRAHRLLPLLHQTHEGGRRLMPDAIRKPVTEEAVGGTTGPTEPPKEARASWFARHSEQPAPGARPHTGLRIVGGLLILAVFILPYAIMFVGSLKSRAEVLGIPPTYIPREWRFDNYISMWSTPETPVGMNVFSTVLIAGISTLIVLCVAMPAAYYTARFRFPGRGAFLFVVLLTQMCPPALVVAGLFREFQLLGIVDTYIAMILVNSAFNLAFSTWIMHSFFASVPKEIDEAAQIDGCGLWTVLFRINLPLVWPGIVTAVIFTFVAAWNEFAASLVILSSAEKQPLSVALTKFVGQYETSWQYVFGVSVIAIIPVLILFGLIEKQLVGGLTAGSIK